MFQLISTLFNALIARPIANLLLIIIALVPGHNLGVAIIIFTLIVRMALYPLLKKQLHHTMAMRKLQPDIKRIKKEAKGDKQREYALMMELYKEREIRPIASIGILFAQLPILLALFAVIQKIVKDPQALIGTAYSWVKELPFIGELAADISKFDTTLAGVVDLAKPALDNGAIYVPAMILVIGSVFVQYYQSRQLIMTDKSARSLKQILKDSSAGKEVDQSEVQAATSSLTLYIIPFFLFIVAVNLPSALSLYWLVGGIIAIIQQTRILNKDVEEMEASVVIDTKKKKTTDTKETIDTSAIPEAKLIKHDKKTGVKTYIKEEATPPQTQKTSKKTAKKKGKSKKRR